MKKLGKELEFISVIKRDGSGVRMMDNGDHLNHVSFEINCLSITEGTYIASEFNSFVVKIKKV